MSDQTKTDSTEALPRDGEGLADAPGSATPKTDKLWRELVDGCNSGSENFGEMTDFARNLERENARLREAMQKIRGREHANETYNIATDALGLIR